VPVDAKADRLSSKLVVPGQILPDSNSVFRNQACSNRSYPNQPRRIRPNPASVSRNQICSAAPVPTQISLPQAFLRQISPNLNRMVSLRLDRVQSCTPHQPVSRDETAWPDLDRRSVHQFQTTSWAEIGPWVERRRQQDDLQTSVPVAALWVSEAR